MNLICKEKGAILKKELCLFLVYNDKDEGVIK